MHVGIERKEIKIERGLEREARRQSSIGEMCFCILVLRVGAMGNENATIVSRMYFNAAKSAAFRGL